MTLAFSRGISVPGGLENATDATIFRVAMKAAKNESEIHQLEKELKQLRAEAKAAKNAAKRASGAAMGAAHTPGTMGAVRVKSKDAAAAMGPVPLRKGASFIRGAAAGRMHLGGVAVVMGAVGAAGAAARAWRDSEEVRAKYGGGELAGRVIGAPFRALLRAGGSNLADVLDLFVSDKATRKGIREGMADFGDLFLSPAQRVEREAARFNARRRAHRNADALVTDQLAEIEKWEPENFQFRTSRDITAARNAIRARDGAAIVRDAAALLEQQLSEADLASER